MTWHELKQWAAQRGIPMYGEISANQGMQNVMGLAPIGSGHAREYGIEHRARLWAWHMWRRLVGGTFRTPVARQRLHEVLDLAGSRMHGYVIVIDGTTDWQPVEPDIKSIMRTGKAFGVLPVRTI